MNPDPLPYGPTIPSVRPPGSPRRPGVRLNVLLFLATVATTIMAGALQAKGTEAFSSPENILAGIPFSAALLSILLAHEMGHYFTSRHYGVPVSLPYFIPVPTIIGTMGAVIRMRAAIRDRRILFDIGIAGPLAGVVFAVAATLIGLRISTVIEAGSSAGGIELGDSLLFMALTRWTFGPLKESQTVLLHPVAFAGWLGFFLTSLNLLPMGQLDGGHVAYGIFGSKHRFISRAVFTSLIIWAVHGVFASAAPLAWLWAVAFCWAGLRAAFSMHSSLMMKGVTAALGMAGILGNLAPGTGVWVVWSILMCFLRLDHPPTRDLSVPLGAGRKALGWIALIVFVLTFIPAPFREIIP